MAKRRRAPGELAELWDLLGDFEFAVALTQSGSGMVRARPIPIENPAEVPGSDLWFVASREAEARGGIDRGSIVGVCCYGAPGNDGGWLSLSTVARVVDDRLTIHRLWKPEWRERLPGGPDDPDLVLVLLDVLRAEHWDPVQGHLRVVYPTAPAGRRPDADAHP